MLQSLSIIQRNAGMKTRSTYHIILLIFSLMIFSCKSNKQNESKDDWNKGTVTIATDENLKDIANQLVQIYEHDYEHAKINLDFQPQDKIINDFINGKITSMMVNRTLTKKEIDISSQHQRTKVIENLLAYNALALIGNKNFKDSAVSLSDLKNYLQSNSSVKLVFDNQQSGIAKLILEKANLDASLFKNALVVNNTNEVIEYVNRNETSIGFIPFNYISDLHTEKANEIRSKVKTLAILQNNTISQISQQGIYDNSYPLQQQITIVLGKNSETVATAFVNWVVKERAAKILLKAGLIPRFMPNRNINVQEELKTN